jgi:orotate phosphoribosyltransferase
MNTPVLQPEARSLKSSRMSTDRHFVTRERARKDMESLGVLMTDGHFDYGNGYHGRVYLNPHQLFRSPSTIWRLAQDLLDILPSEMSLQTEIVAGPETGGALLAHTLAGLLDGRRSLSHPPCSFAPFEYSADQGWWLRPFYAGVVRERRVLLADDVRNTGKTLERCAALVREAGGEVVGAVQIYDRLEPVVDLGVPNVALIEYQAPENFAAATCPLCRDGVPITRF